MTVKQTIYHLVKCVQSAQLAIWRQTFGGWGWLTGKILNYPINIKYYKWHIKMSRSHFQGNKPWNGYLNMNRWLKELLFQIYITIWIFKTIHTVGITTTLCLYEYKYNSRGHQDQQRNNFFLVSESSYYCLVVYISKEANNELFILPLNFPCTKSIFKDHLEMFTVQQFQISQLFFMSNFYCNHINKALFLVQ